MERILLLLVSIALVFGSCQQKPEANKQTISNQPDSIYKPTYAKGFEIAYYQGYKTITLTNPYQGARNTQLVYVVRHDSTTLPKNLKTDGVFWEKPQRIICSSTTQLGPLIVLSEQAAIGGMSGANYVSDTLVQQAFKAGKILEVGYAPQYDFETILSIRPEMMLVYGIDATALADVKRLTDLKIPVVFDAEFLEESPLGKAEWMVFLAAFYNKEDFARKYFANIAESYNTIRAFSAQNPRKPVVLTGLPWQGSWMVSGKDSYIATLIHDAGGRYDWDFIEGHEAVPIELETVFEKSAEATYWLNISNVHSTNEIKAIDSRLATMKPLKLKQLFNNNKRYKTGGGNDYWEYGVVRPDLILKDIVQILQQPNSPADSLFFYTKIH
jgi:iron complex transport system substrate-binding protein